MPGALVHVGTKTLTFFTNTLEALLTLNTGTWIILRALPLTFWGNVGGARWAFAIKSTRQIDAIGFDWTGVCCVGRTLVNINANSAKVALLTLETSLACALE
jgi:hypothetical protein